MVVGEGRGGEGMGWESREKIGGKNVGSREENKMEGMVGVGIRGESRGMERRMEGVGEEGLKSKKGMETKG